MEILKHSLKEINQATGEFALEVHINDIDFEFANELGTPPESNKFIFLAQKIIRENYPSIKITAINVVFGGLLLTSMSIHSSTASAQSDSVQTAQSQSIYYQVSAGDTLWTISRAFNISIDSIRLANKLTSDVLQPNQRLIIPRAFHTVVTGDSLSVLARNYNTTVSAIREANGLTSDTVRIGQTLVIPIFTVAATTQPSAPLSSSEPSFKIQPINEFYTVVSGDSLSVIAARFNTTVAALRTANGLTNDTLKIGQRLVIPHSTTTAKTDSYTVVSGDSLSVIASRFGVSVNDLRSVNNLRSDVLQIGQVLTIPGATSSPSTSTEQRTQSYTVVSGDSISVIASRFGVSVNDLRSVNNLRSDVLQIGQVLTIPGGTSAPSTNSGSRTQSYTVVSGDSLSVIASRFGVSVNDLRSVNNLRSDVLQIGQVLTIPGGMQTPFASPAQRSTFTYTVASGDSLSVIANRFSVTVESIRSANQLGSDLLQVGQRLVIPDALNAPAQTSNNSITYTTHTVRSGDTIWDLSVRYGIPQTELLSANNLTMRSTLSIGQQLRIPVHHIAVKPVVSQRHGELLDWWTEAQYVFSIGKTAKVTDFVTGQSFYIKRTIGANHADCETVSVADTNIARSIWGGFSWTPRAVIVEVDGRRLAASMSFMPHDVQYIQNNGITGHFDVYFSNSTRHVDGRADASHQAQLERAAGIR